VAPWSLSVLRATRRLLQLGDRGFGFRLRRVHVTGLARSLGLLDQRGGLGAALGRGGGTRRLHILTARGLNILATRSLHILTTRGLDGLTTRSLHILTPRGLATRATRSLHASARGILRARSLHVLTTRGLNILTARSLHILTTR